MVTGNPVNTRDDVGDGTSAIVVENLNSNNVSALGNTTILMSVYERKKEVNVLTRGQKQQFRHSEFHGHFRLCPRIQSVGRREVKRGRSLTG